MRSCCSTPRTVVDGGRWATSAPTLCRSTRRCSASATIHTFWSYDRHSGEPRQCIDTKSEGRSLETTVKAMPATIAAQYDIMLSRGKSLESLGIIFVGVLGQGGGNDCPKPVESY